MKEHIVSSKTYYKGRIVKLKVDNIRLQGREFKRAVLVHPGSVAIVPFLNESEIILIRQYRHPIEQTILELPAGTLEEREKPSVCARRELEEETGYTAQRLFEIGSLYLAPGYSSELIHIFVAANLEYKGQNTEQDETIKVDIRSIHDVIREILKKPFKYDAKTVGGLYLSLEYVKKNKLY